jgi:hypothetical protein
MAVAIDTPAASWLALAERAADEDRSDFCLPGDFSAAAVDVGAVAAAADAASGVAAASMTTV